MFKVQIDRCLNAFTIGYAADHTPPRKDTDHVSKMLSVPYGEGALETPTSLARPRAGSGFMH
jgi:hypothetical protein